MLISNFNRLALRDDIGRLWENFCISERLKKNQYSGNHASYYFWRTYDQKEVDLIEEDAGMLLGFEFKWTEKAARIPQEFLNTYPGSTFQAVHRENYLQFVK